MATSRAKLVTRKHRKSKARWKSKNRASLALAKPTTAPKAKKPSVFDRAKDAMAAQTTASPKRTASSMLFSELNLSKESHA